MKVSVLSAFVLSLASLAVASCGSSTAKKSDFVDLCKAQNEGVDCDCAGTILDQELSDKDKTVVGVRAANKEVKAHDDVVQKLKDNGLTEQDLKDSQEDVKALESWIRRRCRTA